MRDFFGVDASRIKHKKLFLLDMDGTIYLDNNLIDGALDFLSAIKRGGGQYVFITNNSSKSVNDYINKVNRLGISAGKENFLTSTQASAQLLLEKYGYKPIYAQGTSSFIRELKDFGLNVTTDFCAEACAVLVGFDLELTTKKLNLTAQMLTKTDAVFYATNPDWVCPVDFGFVPDCGSMCFGLTKATGKEPIFIGKPQPRMIELAMKNFGATDEQVLVVGDRVYTDIKSGINAGVDTALVLSGETTLDVLEKSADKPSFVFNSVKDMIF